MQTKLLRVGNLDQNPCKDFVEAFLDHLANWELAARTGNDAGRGNNNEPAPLVGAKKWRKLK